MHPANIDDGVADNSDKAGKPATAAPSREVLDGLMAAPRTALLAAKTGMSSHRPSLLQVCLV